ncbi:MAG: helix-turn-helix domain-containing protein [Pseudonocardiaceae bacterium]
MHRIDPAFFDDDEVRAALAARDIGALYRLLRRVGVSQRRIADLTGQSQSEVSEILHGRQVLNVRVLERIADGLGTSRARLGVSYGEHTPDTPSVKKEVDENVKRRILLATTMTASLDQAFMGLSELALQAGQPLPSRLSMSQVHTVRTVTERLRGVARYYGGQADIFGAEVALYTRWLEVPAPDAVQAQLRAALAELHIEAGWCHYDSGLDGTAYFTRALRLASEAGDAYGIANAAFVAGGTLVRNGHPNFALKLFQLGQVRLRVPMPGKSPWATDDTRARTLTAWLNLNSATAYAIMGGVDEATRYLAEANDGWAPRDGFERASSDRVNAGIQLDLGQFDTAERFAASAVRTYGEGHRKDRTTAQLILAEVYVRTGEPQGLTLARQAIDGTSALQSVAVRRQRLIPLATALEARPGSDARDLARAARQLATTRI